MQKLVALCAVLAVCAALVAADSVEPVAIVRSESNVNDDGSYKFLYEAANGNYREESGALVNPGTDDESISVSGSYKYIDAEGHEVSVTYTADENGFVPIGSIIAKEISDNAANARNLPNEEVVLKKKA